MSGHVLDASPHGHSPGVVEWGDSEQASDESQTVFVISQFETRRGDCMHATSLVCVRLYSV